LAVLTLGSHSRRTQLADGTTLPGEVTVFTQLFPGPDAAQAGFDVLVAMRERTRIPAKVLEAPAKSLNH
jgi:hypothetical protein